MIVGLVSGWAFKMSQGILVTVWYTLGYGDDRWIGCGSAGIMEHPILDIANRMSYPPSLSFVVSKDPQKNAWLSLSLTSETIHM